MCVCKMRMKIIVQSLGDRCIVASIPLLAMFHQYHMSKNPVFELSPNIACKGKQRENHRYGN